MGLSDRGIINDDFSNGYKSVVILSRFQQCMLVSVNANCVCALKLQL